MLTIFYCTFQNHLTQEARGSTTPVPTPPSGFLTEFIKLFSFNDIFLEKGTNRFRGKRYVDTLYTDQAALDRHKTFTVLLYMMHKYTDICDHRLYSLSGVFAIKQQSLLS